MIVGDEIKKINLKKIIVGDEIKKIGFNLK